MITPAVLDAQMSLTLSLITMSVLGCTTSLFLSGDMLRYCHRDHFLHDLITRVFMRSFRASSMLLSIPIINTALTLRTLETLVVA